VLEPATEIEARQTLQGQGAVLSGSIVITSNKHFQGFRIKSIAHLDKDKNALPIFRPVTSLVLLDLTQSDEPAACDHCKPS
jgi:hypothetical protein